MKRLVFFTLRLALVVAAAVWFAERAGTAKLVWNGYVIETSTGVIALAALALGFAFYLLLRFWSFLINGPANWRLRRKLRTWKRGHDHLTEGLVAIAGGDTFEAGRQAVNARKLLGTTPATRLLQAQAAQLAGDHRTAQDVFRALATEPRTAAIGYRGLIMEARRARDWQEMERLVEKLYRLKPETPWLNLVRFELLTRRQDWDNANDALAHVAAAHLMDSVQVRQNRAAIFTAISQGEARAGKYDKALQAAERAVKQMPEWPPAVINLAQAQIQTKHARAMKRTVERSWPKLQHPQLVALWRAGESDPVEAYRQIERLCRANEDAPVSRLVMADAALAADIWGAARRHLMALISRGEVTQSVYRMMARLERRESGDEQAALQWMTRAADAPPDPAWLCRSCGGLHKEWQAVCNHCGSFNTLDWQSPGVSRGVSLEHQPNIAGELTVFQGRA